MPTHDVALRCSLLSRFAGEGVVHSAFRHALNVAFDSRLLTLLAGDQALARASLVVCGQPDFRSVAPGTPVRMTTTELVAGSVRFSLAGVTGASTAIAHQLPADRQHLLELAAALPAWLARCPPPSGWFDSLRNPQSPYFRTTRRCHQRLEEAASAGDSDALVEACAGLVGFGPGLTPSGDDFLLGLLFVLQLRADAPVARHAPSTNRSVRSLVGSIRERIGPAPPTTDVSRAMLTWVGQGHVSRLHSALVDPRHPLVAGLHRVQSHGHSSGHDTLCGMAFALKHGFGGA